MFLIDAIKPKVTKKLQNFFFARLFRGGGYEAYKIFFFFYRVRLAGGNKNMIQKKRENIKHIFKKSCKQGFVNIYL